MPFFSIITVCFNNYAGLQRTHESIFSQDFMDFEWIVVDGCSTDETQSFINQLSKHNVRAISEVDNGLYDAMNKGIKLARGEFLLFLNSGDELADTHTLATVHIALSGKDAINYAYGDAIEIQPGETSTYYKHARRVNYIWYGMFTHHQAMFYRRSLLVTTHIQYEQQQFPIGADYAFTSEFLKHCLPEQVSKLSIPICRFELGGMSDKNALRGMLDQWTIKKQILRLSLLLRLFIFTTQAGAMFFKRAFPRLHGSAKARLNKSLRPPHF